MPDPSVDVHRVELLLADLRSGLEWPPLPDSLGAARTRLEAGERASRLPLARARRAERDQGWPALSGRRVVWAVAAAVIVAIAAILALPGPRRAVADLLGVGGVRVRVTPTTVPVTVATDLDLGARTTLDRASTSVPFDVYVPELLPPPEQVYVDQVGGRPVVSLVYQPGEMLPPSPEAGVGLLVTEFRGTVEPFIDKIVSAGQAERIAVDGRPALWIEGPHTIFYAEGGDVVRDSEPRLAANTLVISRDDTTIRLEGSFDQATAVGLARSLSAVR